MRGGDQMNERGEVNNLQRSAGIWYLASKMGIGKFYEEKLTHKKIAN